VTVDNKNGMEELLNFLRAAGHRHLVHFAANLDSHDGRERLRAFENFIHKHPEMKGEVMTGEPKREGGRNLLESYLFQHVGRLPDSFVCFNDAMAMGVLHRLNEKGIALRNPHQITGCDDDIYSQYVGLTTLRMPMVRIGQEAANLVYSRLAKKDGVRPAHPQHVVLDLQLMSRGLRQLP
jgi:DNA-binding LacI/PurR family transcriptional regulator